jgi:hypothetical protein
MNSLMRGLSPAGVSLIMVGAVSSFVRAAATHVVELGVALVLLEPAVAAAAVVPSSSQFVPVDLVTFTKTEPPRGGWHRRLTGIVIFDDSAQAMFVPMAETHAVKAGQQIDGWTLTTIRLDGVTLESEGQSMNLRPEKLPHPKTPTTMEQQVRNTTDELLKQQKDQAAGEAALAAATAKMLQTDPRKATAAAAPPAFAPVPALPASLPPR